MKCPEAISALLFLSVLATSSGCRSADPEVEVVFWALGREGEVVEQLVPEFRRRHPGWSVRVQQVPWAAAREKLLTAYVGDALPDVLQIGNTWIAEFDALGALAPLDGLLPEAEADLFTGALESNRVAGVLRGLPWYVDTRLLFYRRDVLAAAGVPSAPRRWEEWREVMQRVRAQSGEAAILLPLEEWQPLVILALQRGARLLRDGDTRGDFQSSAFRAAFDFYLDLFAAGLAPRGSAARAVHLYQDFAAGRFALFLSGPWNLGELARRLPEHLHDAWATAPMPAPDAEYPGVSLAGGASLVLTKAARHRDAALAWIAYLLEVPTQLEFYRRTGDLPSRRAAWVGSGLSREPRVAAFWQQLQRVEATPKIPEWERIAEQIGLHAEAAIRGSQSRAEALVALDRKVDEILAKRRWLHERASPP